MQQSYILSNKENEYSNERPSLRLKINYQTRQKYHQRSKSPLREQCYNHRINLTTSPINRTPPLSNKKTDYNRMNIVESEVQTFSKLYNESSFDIRKKQSSVDLSKIKPISLQNKKIEQMPNINMQNQRKPNLQDESYSKSRHRQNSKHLGFFTKVGNLDKQYNQISSLLSYVYQNKTAPKQKQKSGDNSTYKPRYGLISQNTKCYQRKINGLQKPKQPQPLISKFDVQNDDKLQIRQNKQRKSISYTYKYSNFDQINKSPFRQFDQKSQSKPAKLTPKSSKRQLSRTPNNVCSSSNQFQQFNDRCLQTIKSQQIQSPLKPSQSNQNISKITANNNSDLEFYYESLKKRDQQIQNFKQKLLAPKQSNKNIKIQQQSLSAKYTAPFKKRHEIRSHSRKESLNLDRNFLHEICQSNTLNKTNSNIKKDVFLTEQQVEVYKDISRLNQNNNREKPQKVSSIRRIQKAYNYSDIETMQKIQHIEPYYKQKQVSQISSYYNKSQLIEQSTLSRNHNTSKYLQTKQSNNTDPTITLQIEQQIKKIQNELKDCKKQKSYLRQKYGSILSRQTSKQQNKLIQIKKQQVQTQKKTTQFNPQQHVQCNFRDDKQRMYDSDQLKRREKMNVGVQNQQNYHEKLRNTIISDCKQQRQQNEQVNQHFTNIELQKEQQRISRLYKREQPITNHVLNDIKYRVEQIQPQNQNHLTQNSNFNNHQNFDQRLIKKSICQTIQNKRSVTPLKQKRQFQIKLQKVQVTKPQTTKLGTLLAQKIQIDLKLRDQRQKFIKSPNPNKWNNLRQYLQSRYKLFKSQSQWEQLLIISPEEHNPFSPTSMSSNKSINTFSKQGKIANQITSTEQIPLLSSLLSQSLDFFNNRLLNKFSQSTLKKQHFSFKELDLSFKGYISLQDLICFVNLHSGKFYRNRDIIFLIKSMMIVQNNNHSRQNGGIQCYSSAKGVNQYRLKYDFLWKIFTDKR